MRPHTILSIAALCAVATALPANVFDSPYPDPGNEQNTCYIYYTMKEDYAPRAVPLPIAELKLTISDDLKVMTPTPYHPTWSNGETYDKPQSIFAGSDKALWLNKVTRGNNTLKTAWMDAESSEGKDYL